jgi:hypothetical protein
MCQRRAVFLVRGHIDRERRSPEFQGLGHCGGASLHWSIIWGQDQLIACTYLS